MQKAPNIYKLRDIQIDRDWPIKQMGTSWLPARPLGFFSLKYRIKAAILVFTGKADAVIWPGNQ